MNNICEKHISINYGEKYINTKPCMAFFLKLKRNYLSKMHGYPTFSFWIPVVLTKLYVLAIVLNLEKISLYLKASPIGKPEHLDMRRTYAQ